MEWLGLIGWLVAIGLGIGWWVEHRKAAGVKSDLADAWNQLQKRTGK